MDISDVTWRKASYSGDNGGACVEVGVWRKASHSGGGCVEVPSAPNALVAVRDSKNPDGPPLAFAPPAWQAFIRRTEMSA